MKNKIKKLLDLIKKNNGRGIAAFFKKEVDTAQIDDIVKIKLPHNFVYSFHGTKIEKVKDKEKSYILRGFYYESDSNDGIIKIKLSLDAPSKIFEKVSENEWKVKSILIDKDSIGIIATDSNDNLISLVETNKIKKIKEKKLKQLVEVEQKTNHVEEMPHCPMADINRPSMNLIKLKQVAAELEKEKTKAKVKTTMALKSKAAKKTPVVRQRTARRVTTVTKENPK